MTSPNSGAGLRGQSAGETSICSVGAEGNSLKYRGYDVDDLALNASFNEVAYMIVHGQLPDQEQLDDFVQRIINNRDLPQPLREVLERIPASAHPMDVLRTGCSFLGNIEPELDFDQQRDKAERLLASLPSMICYWYRFSHDGVRIDPRSDDPSIGGHFLRMLHDKEPNEMHSRVMDVSLILYAEHEFNASTFTARVCASTLSDLFSCVTGAIGSLRGPLHGGANEAAMEMIEAYGSVEEAKADVLAKLAAKEKIMGFGHAVYRVRDPRNAIIRDWSKKLSEQVGATVLYAVSEVVEQTMKDEKNMFANADFYHASAYHFMGIPTKLFTPIFVMSRVTGWTAHIFEQRANNRIIRPGADYIGPEARKYQAISERS